MNEHEEQGAVENTRLVNLCKYKTIPISIIIVIVFLIRTMRGRDNAISQYYMHFIYAVTSTGQHQHQLNHNKKGGKNIIKNGFVHLITCNYSIEKI